VWGCNAIVDSGGYHVVPPAADGNMPPPDGPLPGQDACIASPSNRQQLENQCTPYNLACQSFSTPIPGCDASFPCPVTAPTPPPPPDAGSPVDGAATDAPPPPPSCRSYVQSQYGAAASQVVLATGSTALSTFISQVQTGLTKEQTPIYLVFQATGSCVGVASIFDPSTNPMQESLGKVTYADNTGTVHTVASECVVNGDTADIGFSDVFYSSCSQYSMSMGPPNGVKDNFGPVQVMNFIVPALSQHDSIDLQAAYYIFANGGQAGGPSIAPWTNPNQFFIRSSASGTQSMISAALRPLDPAKWWGVNSGSSGGVITNVTNADLSQDGGAIDQSIGIAASDVVDQNRLGNINGMTGQQPTVKILAIQDQRTPTSSCAGAVYPDATSSTYDKLNVRNGIYPIWGPSHLYTQMNGAPNGTSVGEIVDVFTGLHALPSTPLIGNFAGKSVIPLCAMHVSRTSDGQDYSPFKPQKRCDCYYDSKVAGGMTSCQACTTDNDCLEAGTGVVCNAWDGNTMGFCESSTQ
jgi:hypothetical protein